jgi:hypothetical protein
LVTVVASPNPSLYVIACLDDAVLKHLNIGTLNLEKYCCWGSSFPLVFPFWSYYPLLFLAWNCGTEHVDSSIMLWTSRLMRFRVSISFYSVVDIAYCMF